MDNRIQQLLDENRNYDMARQVLEEKYEEAAGIYEHIIYQFTSSVRAREETIVIFNNAMRDNNIEPEDWQIYNESMDDHNRTLGAIERFHELYKEKWNGILESIYAVYVSSERIDLLQRSLIDRIRQRQQQRMIRAIPRAAPAA